MIKEKSFFLRGGKKKVPNLSFAGLFGLGFFCCRFNLVCFQFQSLFLSLSFF